MDTKSNLKNRIVGTLLSLLLLGAIAAGIVLSYPIIYKNYYKYNQVHQAEENNNKQSAQELIEAAFLPTSIGYNYGLFWQLSQVESQHFVYPDEIYLPDYIKEQDRYDYGGTDTLFNTTVRSWYDNLVNNYDDGGNYSIYYAVMNHNTKKILSNNTELEQFCLSDNQSLSFLQDHYDVAVVYQYDSNGKLSVPKLYGTGSVTAKQLLNLESEKSIFKEMDDWTDYISVLQGPKDVTICYGIPKGQLMKNIIWDNSHIEQINRFGASGFWTISLIGVILSLLAALIVPLKKTFAINESILSKVPLELNTIGILAAIAFLIEPMTEFAMRTASGAILKEINPDISYISQITQKILVYGINWLSLFAVLFLFFVFLLSLRQLVILGPKQYFRKRTITGRLLFWSKQKCRKFIDSINQLDFSDKTNQLLFKIAAVNFIILAVISCFWFFGIFALLIYSVCLFFFMKNFTDHLKEKYNILLQATRTIAKGNLNTEVNEDLGIFNPIKEELKQVQQGFKKAVEEETKSQQMKTELITNVSHDLKTPLTAIITYVNLLKEENITEEDRKSYIHTLDLKSQRLKRLIEDLFEVSKANSHNVTLNLNEVDISSLMKEVALELEDKIKESQIEFRYQYPKEKVILKLDSEKTFRIIENLMINITKYALPHSRAYVELKKEDHCAIIIMKNISATELDFDNIQIMERFARGDKSRSTDGSGLGLAIVKSFTELQGGCFEILTDGDLFKAIVTFNC